MRAPGICAVCPARSGGSERSFHGKKEAVEAGADIIMLDNMDHDTMAQAMAIIDGKAEVEVSGNMTEGKSGKIIRSGVDYVSSGALDTFGTDHGYFLEKSASDRSVR